MHLLLAIICLLALLVTLADFFITFLLPRRVRRDPRIARQMLRFMWRPYRAIAARLSAVGSDTMLGFFGPLGLLAILGILSVAVILAFAGLHAANQTKLGAHIAPFGRYLYFSAGTFFSANTPAQPSDGLGEVMQVAEAATGFAFLAIAIGYLPALFQAFSRREAAVSRLDPRAGSPPSAGTLLERSAGRAGWPELDGYLREWEIWTAELMETHLSYPIIGYFRSQHVNQNWLAALTTVVDACAYAIAYGPEDEIDGAALTFRIGRHALADLALAFTPRRQRNASGPERLSNERLAELNARLEGSGLHAEHTGEAAARLRKLRQSYEHYSFAMSRQLALDVPEWVPEEVHENWRTAVHHTGRVLP